MDNKYYIFFFIFVFVNNLLSQIFNIFLSNKITLSIIEKSMTIREQEVYSSFDEKRKKILELAESLVKEYNFGKLKISLSKEDPSYAYAVYHKKESAILIGKNLFENLSIEELLIVICHEFYHLKEKHSEKKTLFVLISLGLINLSFLIFVGSYFILNKTLISIFLLKNVFLQFSELAIVFIYLLIYFILMIFFSYIGIPFLRNYFGRIHEYDADNFAAEKIGLNSYLKFNETFKMSFGDLEKKNKLGFIYETHPSWEERKKYVLERVTKK